MEIEETRKKVLSGGGLDEAEFDVAVTQHTFKVLTEGLYSDKIKAIIRELACNAYDSHVCAGTPDKPFEVKLPARGAATFHVRDYGTGLSHHDVMTLYQTLMKSTKQKTNDMVGCFGLGSKTPFAYTESFTVRSFFDGEERIYSMYMGENGVPKCKCLSAGPTEEPHGLEVSFPVREEDFYSFRTKAGEVFKWFDVKPSYAAGSDPVHFDSPTARAILNGEVDGIRWFMLPKQYGQRNGGSTNDYLGTNTVVMGNVAYPLDHDFQMRLANFIIYVPIGTAAVTPSRETISWTKETKVKMREALERAIESVSEVVSEKVEEADDIFEARRQAGALDHLLLPKGVQVTYKGLPVNRYFNFHQNFPNAKVYVLHQEYNDRGNHYQLGYTALTQFNAHGMHSILGQLSTTVRVDKVFVTKTTIRTALLRMRREYGKLTSKRITATEAAEEIPAALVVTPASFRPIPENYEDDIKKILAAFGGDNPSTTVKVPNPSGSTSEWKNIFEFQTDYHGHREDPYKQRDIWERLDEDDAKEVFKAGGVYVEMSGKSFTKCTHSNGQDRGADLTMDHWTYQAWKMLVEHRWLPSKLIGIRANQSERFDKAKQWTNLFTVLQKRLHLLFKKHKDQSFHRLRIDSYGVDNLQRMLKSWGGVYKNPIGEYTFKYPWFKQHIDSLKDLKAPERSDESRLFEVLHEARRSWRYLDELFRHYSVSWNGVKTYSGEQELERVKAEVYGRYPMLEVCGRTYGDQHRLAHNYIEMIDLIKPLEDTDYPNFEAYKAFINNNSSEQGEE